MKRQKPKKSNDIDEMAVLAGHFNLAAEIIRSCFTNEERFRDPKINVTFAMKGKLIELFCDCTDNFEAERLRNEILKFNIE